MGSKKKRKSSKNPEADSTADASVENIDEASEVVAAESKETAMTSTPRSNRRAVQALADGIGQVATLLCGAGIVMWAVFNLSWNFLAYRADESGESNWTIAFIMVLVTTLLPLLFGFWLLFGSMAKRK